MDIGTCRGSWNKSLLNTEGHFTFWRNQELHVDFLLGGEMRSVPLTSELFKGMSIAKKKMKNEEVEEAKEEVKKKKKKGIELSCSMGI